MREVRHRALQEQQLSVFSHQLGVRDDRILLEDLVDGVAQPPFLHPYEVGAYRMREGCSHFGQVGDAAAESVDVRAEHLALVVADRLERFEALDQLVAHREQASLDVYHHALQRLQQLLFVRDCALHVGRLRQQLHHRQQLRAQKERRA